MRLYRANKSVLSKIICVNLRKYVYELRGWLYQKPTAVEIVCCVAGLLGERQPVSTARPA